MPAYQEPSSTPTPPAPRLLRASDTDAYASVRASFPSCTVMTHARRGHPPSCWPTEPGGAWARRGGWSPGGRTVRRSPADCEPQTSPPLEPSPPARRGAPASRLKSGCSAVPERALHGRLYSGPRGCRARAAGRRRNERIFDPARKQRGGAGEGSAASRARSSPIAMSRDCHL